jgi:DNA topoisomerase I
MYLLITESPAKAKKIQGFLGSDYKVSSSCGHIRDLDKKKLSIDVDHDFKPIYKNLSDKREIIHSLKSLSKGKQVLLAADDDREGEAIAWHCGNVLGVKIKDKNRITYREISKSAILQALKQPREINMCEVNAQQARRIIDRLIGFKLSPCLWKHIQTKEKGLSAGRVQSALLSLLDKRDKKIETYEPEISLTIHSDFEDLENNCEFIFQGSYDINDEFIKLLLTLFSKDRTFTIFDHSKTKEKSYPKKPFITSTLQQSAQNELGFSVSMTMEIAQKLYEGGHITYMRTDSTFISEEFQDKLKETIKQDYGDNIYQKSKEKKVKGAQEAHEAIRPTNITMLPSIDGNQMKLYQFILKRTITSHMKPAEYDIYKIKLHNELTETYGYFTTKYRQLQFPGYLLYGGKEYSVQSKPEFKETYQLISCTSSEKEDAEPNYYNESDVVKLLEDTGIGRPSTYASIISTISHRKYSQTDTHKKKDRIEKVILLNEDNSIHMKETKISGKVMKQRIKVTPLGKKVLSYLQEHFSNIIHKDFTCQVENDLDLISQGKAEWIEVIRKVYLSFYEIVERQMNQKTNKSMKLIGKKKQLTIYLSSGMYGPYLQIVNQKGQQQNKSIEPYLQIINKEETELTLDDCVHFLKHPKKVMDDMFIHIGPYGYYMKYKGKNYKINQSGNYTKDYCLSVIKN